MARRAWVTTLVALALAPLALTAGCGAEDEAEPRNDAEAPPSEAPLELPGLPDAASAREQLAALTEAEPESMDGYSRDHFPHWKSEDGCTVRQQVLQRDGEDVQVGDDCQPSSGTWLSLYDNVTVTEAGDVDIDHMVPLANAWRSGANEWTDDEREVFANDLIRPQLLAVTARSNREKGDQGPDTWVPEASEFHCVYGRAWTEVKHHYDLTVTAAERETLTELLDTCA
ncbi:HNH endonuclease family protein [Streptomyces sp. DSM 44915]|uniref:HNH endonuclease family protein n=1 Tax=Streptomyces chisholmiae TaxID=3075540 RepID=A0ABU2JU64_9ACTN|nr:HNH endonuclease family protein [Streptomyces sp. DSM 44915]MDT0268284.1 HNH endonuclease family protein [Streptomyces sp. DSM 44915]